MGARVRTTTAALLAALLAGCGSTVLVETEDVMVLKLGRSSDPVRLAARHLGDPALAWRISDLNAPEDLRPGGVVLAAKRDWRPTGVWPDGVQTVPVLAYHRFAAEGPCKGMTVCARDFEDQLRYLADNGYVVVGLKDFALFLRGERQLPRKAVVLTIDDGWRSTADIAEPLLAKYGARATLFLYTDFVGARAAVDWDDAAALGARGVVDVQAHSKTHADLSKQKRGETWAQYKRRVREEAEVPASAIAAKTGARPFAFAYPYGTANTAVAEEVRAAGYEIAATVERGANPAFANPYFLSRTMIYGEDDLDVFARRLQTFRDAGA